MGMHLSLLQVLQGGDWTEALTSALLSDELVLCWFSIRASLTAAGAARW
jgi:hypothetical protein